MQIEIYNMTAVEDSVSIQLEAVCDSFSSLLWDVEYYSCGTFEVYIAATPQNLNIFKIGKIVGRDDDKQHYGIIESVQLQTDAENGDYLTITGRFLMSLLARRIINPTFYFKQPMSYGAIVRAVVTANAMMEHSVRKIPGLVKGGVFGECWEQTTRLQISYKSLMEWVYKICELVGGTANIKLQEISPSSSQYKMIFELSQGTDRSILQDKNPHIVFSDSYNNLLSFDYLLDCSAHSNFAYIFGKGEGAERKRTEYFSGNEPSYLDRYEIFVDAKDLADEEQSNNGETIPIPESEYTEMLREKGAENLVPITETSESTIATDGRQYQYNKDYFIGDYVTVLHERFGLKQAKIQLVGMIESFDQNGRSLTPTFKGG